ncbi:MAG: two-component regulator propeller domain-containing protein [Fluviicola sp.]|nr:two-component regulator propeller domain-containing protein [Fluviicola sp.]
MRIFGLFLLCILGVIRLNAQVTPYHYTIRAELSSQLIYCLAQDSYGRLLIGTDEGLYRYNGFKSKHIIASGNSSKEITQLLAYEDGFLATNGSGQLLELKGDKLKVINLSGFRGDIRQLLIVKKELIITGSKYITVFSLPDFKWVSQEVIPYTEPEATVANHVLRYGKSRMAVLNSGELVNIDKGESRNIPNTTGKMLVTFGKQLVIVPSFMAEDPVYTYGDGLFRSWGTLLNKGNLRVNNAKVVGNQLFVLSENGVFVYSNKISKKPAHWFQGIATTDIFKDKSGNVWIATKGKGLLFIPSGRHEIIYGGTLLSIVPGPAGSFFGGTLDGSIVQFDRRGRELNTYASPINNQEAVFMTYDLYSNQLFSNIGLFAVGNPKAVNKTNEALKGVARLADGSVYLAKSTGVVFIPKPGKKTPLFGLTDSTKLQLLRSEPAKGIALNERNQEVAFSTVKGVFRRVGEEPYQEITLNGKSIDAQAITWFKNDLIIATAQHELLLVQNGRVMKRKDLSLNSGELFVLKMTATEGYVYILTEKGMYRFNDLDKNIEGLKELTGLDGLVMRDFAVVKDQLYIVTQRGVLFLTWKQSETMNYSLVLSEITGRKYDHYNYKDDRIQFPFDEKLIVIPFECVDLSGNQQFIIRYAIHTKRERGYWNALPASAEQLNLSHLNPGNYTVEFYLYDPVSQTKGPIQRKQFTVLYEWHNRPYLWWFIGILFAFFVGLTWRWSLRRERKKYEVVNER